MRKFSVDQKLRLVEQIHSRYNRNQYDLSNRERILYGRTSEKSYFYKNGEGPMPDAADGLPDDTPELNTFQIRLLAALVLAVGLILLDKNGGSIAGLSAGQIFDTISADYEDDLDAWLEAGLTPQMPAAER